MEASQRPLRIKEAHVGISYLENDEKVITPFGKWGRAYVFSEDLYRRLERTLRAITRASAVWCISSFLFYVVGVLNTHTLIEALVLGAVFLDIVRLGLYRLIFLSARIQRTWSRLSDLEKSFAVFNRSVLPIFAGAICIFFEFIFVQLLVFDIVDKSGHRVQDVITVIVCHVTAYLCFRMHSYFTT